MICPIVAQTPNIQAATGSIASVMLCAWLVGQYFTGRNGLKATEDQKQNHAELIELVKHLAQRPAEPTAAAEEN